MTNLSSSPQLLIPIIPSADCPKGDLVSVLNYIFQTYLAQATISIPNIGDVTPEQITALQDQITELKNQVDAAEVNIRSGTVTGLSADTTSAVAFATAMPDASYDINIELIGTGAETATASSWLIVGGTKTKSGFSIRTLDLPVTVTSFFWSVRQIPAA